MKASRLWKIISLLSAIFVLNNTSIQQIQWHLRILLINCRGREQKKSLFNRKHNENKGDSQHHFFILIEEDPQWFGCIVLEFVCIVWIVYLPYNNNNNKDFLRDRNTLSLCYNIKPLKQINSTIWTIHSG